jgi:ectoine hydroxylase-related dioxygenase (phytanoyl-CoA dioxygenase family)
MNAIVDHRSMDRARASAMAFLLETEGFCVARKIAPPELIARINSDLDTDFRETPFGTGGFYGERTKRFGRLLSRSAAVADLVLAPAITKLVERILGPWCDNIQLNVAQAIEIHPGALAQFPHRDQDMWPDAAGSHEYLINVIWPLTPFTQDNGATMVWPDSHGLRAVTAEPSCEPVSATSDPGDALIFLGSTLHSAGANTTLSTRRAIVIGYSLGWLKPYENPWLSYPPEVARHFSAELAGLVGYRQHRPNLGNFEGQCPSVLLKNGRAERLGAVDALRPEQAEALSAYVAQQLIDQGAATVVADPDR